MVSDRYALSRLLLRACMPTLALVCISLFVVVLFVVGHIVFLSVQAGTLWPGLLDGYFGAYYTNDIVQPILSFSSQPATDMIQSVVTWSIIGGVAYALVEWSVHAVRTLHQAGGATRGKMIWRTLLARTAWRFGVGCCFLVCVVLCTPLFKIILHNDQRIFAGGLSGWHIAILCLESVGVGLVLCYAAVVFLRLYMFRTRLFGEIIA